MCPEKVVAQSGEPPIRVCRCRPACPRPHPPGPQHHQVPQRGSAGFVSDKVRDPLRGVSLAWVIAGEVGRCMRWLVFVDKGAAQFGVGFAGAGEVASHDG